MEEKDNELQTNFGATRCFIWGLALVGTAGRICATFATCSWEPLVMRAQSSVCSWGTRIIWGP